MRLLDETREVLAVSSGWLELAIALIKTMLNSDYTRKYTEK